MSILKKLANYFDRSDHKVHQKELFKERANLFGVNVMDNTRIKIKDAGGIPHWPYDKKYRVLAFVSLDQKTIGFDLNGKSYVTKLAVFGKRCCVSFKDTSPHSYGAGRYINFQLSDIEKGCVYLDFNMAVNLLCAYSDRYICNIPELVISSPVEAGEKTPEGGWY